MYQNTKWLDRVVDADTGDVIQEGTDQSAGNFNNMEAGISDSHTAAAMLLIAARQFAVAQAADVVEVTLTNTASYPFNNSQQTVSLPNLRATTDYTVHAEILEHSGEVGDIIISDKLLNGFKVRYDGSATSATIKLIIKGGM